MATSLLPHQSQGSVMTWHEHTPLRGFLKSCFNYRGSWRAQQGWELCPDGHCVHSEKCSILMDLQALWTRDSKGGRRTRENLFPEDDTLEQSTG